MYNFTLEEKANRGPLIPYTKAIERTAKSTRIGESTVKKFAAI